MASFGLGFRPPYYSYIAEHKPDSVDFFEITSENFMLSAAKPLRFLEQIRSHYPVAMHGVSMSIASFDPPSSDFLARLKELTDRFDPIFVSDHLCWTRFDAHNSHDLLPLPYTREALARVLKNLDIVQNHLGRRILLENPTTYVTFSGNEMSETDFWKDLCQKSGCGILLDINNIFVNAKNLGTNPIRYLEALPLAAIGYFHLAGHSSENGVLIDTHDHPVCDEVWSLYKIAVQRWPEIPTLLERDDRWPLFSDLTSELNKARALHAEALKYVAPPPTYAEDQSQAQKPEVRDQMIYRNFLDELAPQARDFSRSLAVLSKRSLIPPERGFDIYRHAYAGRLTSVLKEIYPTLAFIMEVDGFSETAREYFEHFKPNHFSVTMACEHFAEFLNSGKFSYDFGVPPALLADMARVEWAKIMAFNSPAGGSRITLEDLQKITAEQWPEARFDFSPSLQVLSCGWDVLKTIAAEPDEAPEIPKATAIHYVVGQSPDGIEAFAISREEFLFLNSLRERRTVAHSLQPSLDASALVGFLGELVTKGLVSSFQTIAPSSL